MCCAVGTRRIHIQSCLQRVFSVEVVQISSSVTSIGDEAFSGGYNLKTITIPDSVSSIGEYGFDDCYGVDTFFLPLGLERHWASYPEMPVSHRY